MNQPPRSKVFLEGRYRKLARDLPQTVFFCPDCKGHPRRRRKCQRCEGYGKLTRDSVQELVGWVAGKAFKTRKNRFHGAGREDIDVRMLGGGRPFILELVGPKNLSVDLAELEAEINRRNEGRLEISGLHWTEKSRVQVIKETPHAKEYAALVEVAQPVERARIDELLAGRIEVTQRTPDRVAHRRADKRRVRWVEFLTFEQDADEPQAWAVRLRTQHGTYVKEVLSGEGGRTEPSLSSLLGVPCTCRHLDVLAILDAEGREEEPEYVAPPVFGRGLDEEKG
jgi:tRNA pseudouridine synthase 10